MHDLPLTNTDVASRTPSLHSHLLKEQDVDAEIVASMAYQANSLAEGTEVVQGVFARILEDPATAKLRYDRESDEFMESSSTTSANDTLTTRASVPHFVDLVHDREVHELVRVTSWVTRSEYGHLVAVGPDGFHLCTCLRQLVYGLVCRHVIIAMSNKQASFNAASVHPRWRNSGRPWTLAPLAAKPARLAAAVAASVAGDAGTLLVDGTDEGVPAHSSPVTYSNPNDATYVYASSVAFGKELAALTKGLGRPRLQRVLANLTTQAKLFIDVEKKSMNDALTSRVFTGVVSRPSAGDDPGAAGVAGGEGRGDQEPGTRGRGGRGGRGGCGGLGEGGRGRGGRGQPGAGGGGGGQGQTAPMSGTQPMRRSGVPFGSLDNINAAGAGGAQVLPAPPIPPNMVRLEDIQSLPVTRARGKSKRHRGS